MERNIADPRPARQQEITRRIFIYEAAERYPHDHKAHPAELFERLREETHRGMPYPQMQVRGLEWPFLKMMVWLVAARRVLEIGMFTGYSGLIRAGGLPDDAQLITCDVNPKAEAIARRYFTESNHGHKIEIRM